MRSSIYAAESRALFQTAMLVFVITVVIGILNGIDIVEFSRDVLSRTSMPGRWAGSPSPWWLRVCGSSTKRHSTYAEDPAHRR